MLLFRYCLKCHAFKTPTFERSPRGIRGDQVSHNEAAVWTDERRNVTEVGLLYITMSPIMELILPLLSEEGVHLTESNPRRKFLIPLRNSLGNHVWIRVKG